jgi:hypothetical protein
MIVVYLNSHNKWMVWISWQMGFIDVICHNDLSYVCV